MSEEIYLEKKTGYAIMTINRPKQMNALNTGIVEQIDNEKKKFPALVQLCHSFTTIKLSHPRHSSTGFAQLLRPHFLYR